jgi:hypothetical protein
MQMIRHDHIGINIQAFILLAILNIIDQFFHTIFPRKYINPANDCKRNKIYFAFLCFAFV